MSDSCRCIAPQIHRVTLSIASNGQKTVVSPHTLKKVFTNKYGRIRLLRHHLLHSVSSIRKNKKNPKLLRFGAFDLHTIFDLYQRAFVHFWNLGPILLLGTAFAHF